MSFKIDDQSIIDAAITIIRRDGIEKVSMRSIAKELGCSTQPIYYIFDSMDSLKNELIKKVYSLYSENSKKYLKLFPNAPFTALGIGLVKFAKEESCLFRYIYFYDWLKRKASPSLPLKNLLRRYLKEQINIDNLELDQVYYEMIPYIFGLACMANYEIIHMDYMEIFQRITFQINAIIEYQKLLKNQ